MTTRNFLSFSSLSWKRLGCLGLMLLGGLQAGLSARAEDLDYEIDNTDTPAPAGKIATNQP